MTAAAPDEPPIVIVGSGPSGATAAREAVLAGGTVVMLESGFAPPKGLIVRAAGHTLMRWRSMTELRSDRHVAAGDPSTEWWSSLSPGGLSNYWTAAVPRFAPDDFADGARLDERFRWPVGYDDLAEFYARAEELLSITGPRLPLSVLPLGQARYRRSLPHDWAALTAGDLGRDLTLLPLARGRRWMVALRGSEFNSYQVVVDPLRASDRFELRLGAHVTRLSVEGDVVAVEYQDATTRAARRIVARAVVLAAGTVDTTRILLSSRSNDAPAGLGNDQGVLGRYLHDHPREWWVAQFDRPMTMLDHPAYLARLPFADSPPLSGSSATIGLARSRDRVRTFARLKGLRFGVQVFATEVPDDRVGVALSPERVGEFGMPLVVIDSRYDERALRGLQAMRERFREAFSVAGVGVSVEAPDWMPRPGSSVHYAGSARMHDDPAFGVVDRWNRVHGTPNVVVADMACFTTNPEKNPTLTAMALAGRAARRLVTHPPSG
jgi:choline dehydrogenase-like flavoprotein